MHHIGFVHRRPRVKGLLLAWCLGCLGILHSAPTLALEPRIVNSLGMTFVLIPPGTFMMGSPSQEAHRDADERLHQVVLTRPFYLQISEVTLGQWRRVMGRGFFSRHRGEDSFPVRTVSYFDCQEFIEAINRLDAGRYRLPTEAEWEYAARAGTTTAYCWGDTLSCSQAMFGNNTAKDRTCVPSVRSRGFPVDSPAPVMSYPPNPWGLYDMHGNLWEWCSDWYGPYPHEAVTDPKGPDSGSKRVRRGGSWFKYDYYCRSANRNTGHPASRYRTTGFRLVMEVSIP